MIGGKLPSHVAYSTMIKRLKKWIGPSKEDLELADKIRKLYGTHNVTITRSGHKGWRISVEKKKEST